MLTAAVAKLSAQHLTQLWSAVAADADIKNMQHVWKVGHLQHQGNTPDIQTVLSCVGLYILAFFPSFELFLGA